MNDKHDRPEPIPGALIASGGWCAPGEAAYDGLGIPPEVQIPREPRRNASRFRGPSAYGGWLDESHRKNLSVEMDFKVTEENKDAIALMAGVKHPSSVDDLYEKIRAAVSEALNKQLSVEEVTAAAAIAARCGYAIIREDAFSSNDVDIDNSFSVSRTWTYIILQNWPRVERLEFPSFEAYDNWAALPLEQRLREADEHKEGEG